ncbi:hypothetical protein CC77DRAFT_1023235 [Alternaria alternata]|uniref:DUF4604 domain-containing protein n=2 Tax=Alternaria alternata complex TaxID=187734 RepID=A0A177DBA0_ALTAL|nr:hypothetical protein CC77DRAFT_1023235 [Alternaria alternata]XP_051590891.1 uncharacterized protein J4E82_003218 [Alternaria postmessia]RII16472.1 hypothetical protein CUC08_Gglean002910 [Alternaria sp. MG1]RYN25806.1 hypothetical protein AA0115_g7471 [Alternaria tenuissima]KAI5378188.1 hypothetical protein J4E82_003218 [Alternaria postmessia]OAG17063.1 hypothetical protein CC77DRAFT_1023235 [Alternaria alternata]RYN49913.1 hypothetical protein AA0118_g11239 [Alternaria tenuissima]
MSNFKAKDLHFDNSQPAFLQRLRGQLTSGDTARHEHPIARNKRMKKDDDEDDAPTYVMEETNQSLSKEEYDALVSGKDGKEGEETVTDEVGEKKDNDSKSQSKDKIAEVGANAKKRKAAKIISEDQSESKGEEETAVKKPDAKPAKKPKKKAKAVKLTFGEDEG